MFKYLQIDKNGVAYSFTETHSEIIAPDLIAASDASNMGRKWDGEKFVDLPKKYKVWSAIEFATICGQAVYDAIVDGNAKDLRYYKYLLDKADIVDLNIPQYFAMVNVLKTKGILPQAIYDVLTVKE